MRRSIHIRIYFKTILKSYDTHISKTTGNLLSIILQHLNVVEERKNLDKLSLEALRI